MAVALIADAHLGGPGGDGRELVAQLDSLNPENCELALFLGDLFHIWIGDPRFETPVIERTVEAIRRLRRRGVSTVYIEGNRDFFLSGGVYADAFDAIVLEHEFRVGSRAVLAVHGDGLNERDWKYRFWRRLSKNPVSRFFCFRLPRKIAQRIIHGTEQQLARTNFKHKSRIPEGPIRRFGERRLAGAFELLLLGHFHEDRQYDVAGGEVRILNAWFREPELVWLEP